MRIIRSSSNREEAKQKLMAKYPLSERQTDAILERYIEGRELYVGIIGNQRLTVFPVWELHFTKRADEVHRIATDRVKWSTEYQRKYHQITTGSEYFLFWEEETMHLLYVKDVTADSALTAAAEMMWMAAKKF